LEALLKGDGMKFQLILQFPAHSIDDFDRLIAVENAIEESIGMLGEVDGHDAGSGEMNLFIFTDDPISCFDKIKMMPELQPLLSELKAAYREETREAYSVIYPGSSTPFSVA
jgi:hypothetical protein